MKKLHHLLLLTLITFLAGCVTYSPGMYKSTEPGEGTTLIKVEYRDEKTVGQEIIQILKSTRIADQDVHKNGSSVNIEARYRSLTAEQAEYMKQQLKQLTGVLDVEIVKDGMPTRNSLL